MANSDAPEVLTYSAAETAVMLNVSENHVYGLARRGEIPSFRLGRRVLIPRRAIDGLVKGDLICGCEGGAEDDSG